MTRPTRLRPPKRISTRASVQNRSQPLPDIVLEGQSSVQLPLGSSFAFTNIRALSIEVELNDEARGAVVETRPVSTDQVTQAQRIIASANEACEAEQNRAIEEAIKLLYPYPPRDGQRDALRQLIYLRQDLVLIAKTSFGKSMILQAVSILVCRSITVVVLPLDQIGQEQAEYITRIGGRPCFLNANTINKKVLADIQGEEYTHILISPELAISDKFHATVTNPEFKERLGLVVIDEAHLVSQWGRDFRKDYARLGQLRSLFGSHIPWFACSATLDAETLDEVKRGAGFDDDVTIMRTSIDRPELVIRLGWIPNKARQKASALRFLFDRGARMDSESTPMPQRIPKTIVFFDSKKEAYTSMQECRNWLQESDQHRFSQRAAKDVIKIFHRDTAKFDKEAIIAEFQRLREHSSIRVIFATEALGMGVNLPDVRRVVLNGLPKGWETAIMWQRGGRAGRDGLDGEIILLVDEWVKGPRIETPQSQKGRRSNHQPSQNSQSLDEAGPAEYQKNTRKLTLPERRGKLPNFWYMLTNEPSCLRARLLDHFDEPQEFRIHIRNDRCCSNCNSDLQLGKLDNHYLYNERGNSLNTNRKRVLELITAWAERQLSVVFPNPSFQPTVYCFITEDQLTQLAKDAHVITNLNSLYKALGSWRFFDSCGAELLAQLRAAHHAVETISQSSRKAKSQTLASGQSSQCVGICSPVATPESISQSTPSQSLPLLPQSASPQGLADMPVSTRPVVPARRPLGELSGNETRAARKRSKKGGISLVEPSEPVPSRELLTSTFGRVRKASRRLVESR